MANATPSRLGQVNGADAVDALWLKVFGGEVMTAFEQDAVFRLNHIIRTIASGKSAQFPATGRIAAARYHTPGEEITGSAIKHAETVITIDDLLIADAFIANIDELKNHYDVRSIYSTELGRALAQAYDKNVAQTGLLAARASNVVTGLPGGTRLNTETGCATDGEKLAGQFFKAAQSMDEKFVPSDERNGFVRPAQYYLLAQTTKILNKDWGGQGSYSDGKVVKIADITLQKTNNLPSTNVTTGLAKYQGDFRETVALVMRKDAVGTVKLLDLAVESGWDMRRQGTLMIAKYALGHGQLRVEAACEIEDPSLVP